MHLQYSKSGIIMNDIKKPQQASVKQMPVTAVKGFDATAFNDVVSVEEPLEIRLCHDSGTNRVQKSISVTMRTPGNDPELAIGFLFTEGIIDSYGRVERVQRMDTGYSFPSENIIQVDIVKEFVPALNQSDRNFYTTSSCGVCGKSSIQSIKTVSQFQSVAKTSLQLDVDIIYQLPEKLRVFQNNFSATGGMHASGLFSINGTLLLLKEDVGRHNALDKLIGAALMDQSLPLSEHILLLSGRASFELIQKASMAGISIVAAIGAPSTLAVDLAKEFDITLIGFLKENKFNIYHLSKHISIPALHENKN